MANRIKVGLVEVVVAVVVIGVLVALMLPATQSAREAARRNSRLNDMRDFAAESVPESAASPTVSARYANFQVPQASSRRIIFEANLSLVVKKISETEVQITKSLKQVDGYVADASVNRAEGQQLTGMWKVRVPVTRFEGFLDDVAKLGVAESRRQSAQDVTEEYVDLEAQITNKKRLEERIVTLLKESAGKIKDVLEVENELARVRGQIEQMEGRLRYLTNRTDFTTVTITAREEENYVPPMAPTFGNQIAQAWAVSLGTLRTFGERLTIASVFAVPWLAVAVVLVVPAYLFVRRRNASVALTRAKVAS